MWPDAVSRQAALLNPSTLTWTATGSGKFDINDEEGWTLLPNGKVLAVNASRPTLTSPPEKITKLTTQQLELVRCRHHAGATMGFGCHLRWKNVVEQVEKETRRRHTWRAIAARYC